MSVNVPVKIYAGRCSDIFQRALSESRLIIASESNMREDALEDMLVLSSISPSWPASLNTELISLRAPGHQWCILWILDQPAVAPKPLLRRLPHSTLIGLSLHKSFVNPLWHQLPKHIPIPRILRFPTYTFDEDRGIYNYRIIFSHGCPSVVPHIFTHPLRRPSVASQTNTALLPVPVGRNRGATTTSNTFTKRWATVSSYCLIPQHCFQCWDIP
ncbi:hypothetical protein PR048_019079 [Dryococelus australis]|uniref:Uncharacterized protein n=1 Tax=Dryococelus australis TaxID=614101 RepID=A0ABQ9H2J2_9NEOP|nr:hypothetical protein PR048_019079 [Dryococelus australis]